MRKSFAVAVAFSLLALVSPASAHWRDAIVGGAKAGPIVLGETTVRQAKRWFGEPTDQRIVQKGCVRAVKVKWGDDLIVFAQRYQGRFQPIGEAVVGTRVLRSEELGNFQIHTRRDLRVGDSEERLRELYPNAQPETHRGHTHYVLGTGRNAGRLLGKVIDGTVMALETVPYEWC
jgi:hypothetical protein